MTARYHLLLQIAPGDGIISRKATALLFIPQPVVGVEKLVRSFVAAPDGDELEAIADAIVDNDFAVPAFACVQVLEKITLRVFGALEIRTDQRSVRSLSGLGSATWIDHRMHGHPDAVQIAVTDTLLDEITDVALGTVHAGGFNLLVTSRGDQPSPDEPTLAVREPGEPTVEPPMQRHDNPPRPDDPEFLKYILGAFDLGDLTLGHDPTFGDDQDPTFGDDHGPSSDHVVHASTSSVCVVVLDDGERFELVDDIVIGRNPHQFAASIQATPVVVNGDRVSRAHLLLRRRDGHISVEDCGSRNGSVLVPGESQPPTGLAPSSPQIVGPGATVYFGNRSLHLEGAAELEEDGAQERRVPEDRTPED